MSSSAALFRDQKGSGPPPVPVGMVHRVSDYFGRSGGRKSIAWARTAKPDDPEFRSALVAYLEWETRLAVINSRPGASVDDRAPMPQWGWGVPGGPYVPPGS